MNLHVLQISLTLVFTIAVSGNLSSYLQHASKNFHWHYNFHLVSYASTTIIMYVCLVPIILWSLLKWSIKSAEELDADTTADVEGVRFL